MIIIIMMIKIIVNESVAVKYLFIYLLKIVHRVQQKRIKEKAKSEHRKKTEK